MLADARFARAVIFYGVVENFRHVRAANDTPFVAPHISTCDVNDLVEKGSPKSKKNNMYFSIRFLFCNSFNFVL